MYPVKNSNKIVYTTKIIHTTKNILKLCNTSFFGSGICLLLILTSTTTNFSSVYAHKVKIDSDVGATLHIEPNDNPRSGEPAKTWFALTRKGGKVIPLSECDCKLKVYKEPFKVDSPPIIEPELKAVDAERYQGIPGSEIVFPQPGAYQLKLSGSAINPGSFKAFELNFPVTVAFGKKVAKNTDESRIIPQEDKAVDRKEIKKPGETKTITFPIWGIGLSAIAVLGILLFIALQKIKQ